MAAHIGQTTAQSARGSSSLSSAIRIMVSESCEGRRQQRHLSAPSGSTATKSEKPASLAATARTRLIVNGMPTAPVRGRGAQDSALGRASAVSLRSWASRTQFRQRHVYLRVENTAAVDLEPSGAIPGGKRPLAQRGRRHQGRAQILFAFAYRRLGDGPDFEMFHAPPSLFTHRFAPTVSANPAAALVPAPPARSAFPTPAAAAAV